MKPHSLLWWSWEFNSGLHDSTFHFLCSIPNFFLDWGTPMPIPVKGGRIQERRGFWEHEGGPDFGEREHWWQNERVGIEAGIKGTVGSGVEWRSNKTRWRITWNWRERPGLLLFILLHLFSPFKISTEQESTKRKKNQKGPAKTKKLKVEKRESSKSIREKFDILSIEVCWSLVLF